jgi:hypothetical protein
MSFTIPPAVINERIAALRKHWENFFPIEVPTDDQFRTWLSSNSFLTVAYGLSQAFGKFCKVQGNLSQQEIIRYSSRVMLSRTKVPKILKRHEKENSQCLIQRHEAA